MPQLSVRHLHILGFLVQSTQRQICVDKYSFGVLFSNKLKNNKFLALEAMAKKKIFIATFIGLACEISTFFWGIFRTLTILLNEKKPLQ